MPKSPFAKRLDAVQAELAPLFRLHGFARHGRTFNRQTEDRLIQVVSLQMGQPAIGTLALLPAELAHLGRDLSGRFTVNLGVHLGEIWDCNNPRPAGHNLQDHHCQIRARLGELCRMPDAWWPLDQPSSPLAFDIGRRLVAIGLPFLDRFRCRDDIIRDWVAFNADERLLSSRARVDVAVLLATRGDAAGAVRLLGEQVRATPLKLHADYVRALARKLGLGELPT
ncbi:DUF4304 domain-containing protein [Phreatobacter stygius]|uniref:DUF4304 domain-containing protein n=1 Tax=Phreatobacter stygius TaxID=1940610 RepID=A0A4D7B938_9HYPH|nr:DUF4304 domain-containing protein [Phreatobacter stygius]QCI67313.1 hypothetical protein E8M01_25655 [Phreatobacter stygius]